VRDCKQRTCVVEIVEIMAVDVIQEPLLGQSTSSAAAGLDIYTFEPVRTS
jgi:hypothetical protein